MNALPLFEDDPPPPAPMGVSPAPPPAPPANDLYPDLVRVGSHLVRESEIRRIFPRPEVTGACGCKVKLGFQQEGNQKVLVGRLVWPCPEHVWDAAPGDRLQIFMREGARCQTHGIR